eukprot:TRINITY_DN16213_c1_g1_i1.p1 TRINITY_DN16213_c1_g1~~TRINITY_DN16213_c1_g1_i1.p1  ORF type:complete len:239 (+),score=33.66 TRINITY_DN16213_c1_g1_i1:2-718(+)
MLKVFTDHGGCTAAFVPCFPQTCVISNLDHALLRLVDTQTVNVLAKLKPPAVLSTLTFDSAAQPESVFLFAGTVQGKIYALKAEASTLSFKLEVFIAQGRVTCITFVPANHGKPPCLLANCADSCVGIVDCTYEAGALVGLMLRNRVQVAHRLLALTCCYSPSGQGYLISGSEDKDVYIYNLGEVDNTFHDSPQRLKHHAFPVVAVAVNLQDTLLASADSDGKVVLWRRTDVVTYSQD